MKQVEINGNGLEIPNWDEFQKKVKELCKVLGIEENQFIISHFRVINHSKK